MSLASPASSREFRFSLDIHPSLPPGQPRLGSLTLPRLASTALPLPTPNFLAQSSRGVVPHLTPDVLRDIAGGVIEGVHFALEDCM